MHPSRDSPSAKMEIFGDGELERELRRSELQATGLVAWWRVFSDTYEELVRSVASPVRAEYAVDELGERELPVEVDGTNELGQEQSEGDMVFVRSDFQLQNVRGEVLECSFWRRAASDTLSAAPPPPCVVYLHGMSSSRKECVYLRRRVLRAGFSLFALDLSGAGKSGGDRVSFGYFERDDVRVVVDYLYATQSASHVALWGRDIGAVAGMLHVRDRLAYRYETWGISRSNYNKFMVVEDKSVPVFAPVIDLAKSNRSAAYELLFVRQPSGGLLSHRWSKYSAQNGDFVLLAVDGEPVQGMNAEACTKLIQTRLQNSQESGGTGTEPTIRLTGYRRHDAAGSKKPVIKWDENFVFALAADSVYGDMEQVVWDMLTMISASAERRSLYIPGPMVTAVQKLLTNSIGRAGGYSLPDTRLLDEVPHFSLPCLFLCASKKDFFMPSHTMALLDKYGGPKSFVQFTGTIDENRPADVLDTVMNHFCERLKLANGAPSWGQQ